MPYLIDGYNVYHAAVKTYGQWSHLAPSGFCRLIAEDMQRLRDKGIIVFDGVPPRGWSLDVELADFVKVLHSGVKSDADTLIVHLISKNTAPRRLTVISSDRQIRQGARRRKCISVIAQDYLLQMIQRIEQPPPSVPKEPREKRTGLQEGQLRKWLDIFGIDPDLPDENHLFPY